MGAKTRARGDPKAGASCKGFSHNFVKIEIRKAAVFPSPCLGLTGYVIIRQTIWKRFGLNRGAGDEAQIFYGAK